MQSDILKVLSHQHAEIDHLLAGLFARTGQREIAFIELASLVAAHVAVETQVFFPNVMLETSDVRKEAVMESLALKRHVADMLGLEADGRDAEEFDLKLGQLADRFDRHAHRFEDNMLFPLLDELMDEVEREELGVAAERLYGAMMRRDDVAVPLAA